MKLLFVCGLFPFLLQGAFVCATVNAQNSNKGEIRGRITDASGLPIEGAEVLVSDGESLQLRAVSDERGIYRVMKLSAGDYLVSAALRGFSVAKDSIYVGPGETKTLDLGLLAGNLGPPICALAASGKIALSNAKPVVGATITLMNVFNRRSVEQGQSDQQGRFRFEIPGFGQYLVYVTLPGYSVAVESVIFPPTTTQTTPCRIEKTVNLVLSAQ